jgi:hypothetical protein
MRTLRLSMAAIVAVALIPLAAASASAAPPANDEVAGAVALSLGDRVVQDTSEATTNAGDDALNADCGAPATNGSVWYKYTPSVNRPFVLDQTASDFEGGFLVFEGTPTAESLLTCGPGMVAVNGQEGTTYNIMAISTDAAGGRLVLSLKNPPPAPNVNVTIAKRGKAYRGGAARIHGHYYCRNGDFAGLFGSLTQRAGRLKIPAEFGRGIRCDGQRHAWSVRLVSRIGTYARGPARARVTIEACGVIECNSDTAKRRIRLVWAKRHGASSLQPSTNRIEGQLRPLIDRQGIWPGS